MAQVSMNIEDRRAAPPARRSSGPCAREAERLGVEAGEGELVGPDPGRRAARASPSGRARHRRLPARARSSSLPALRAGLMAKRKTPQERGPPPVDPRRKAAAAAAEAEAAGKPAERQAPLRASRSGRRSGVLAPRRHRRRRLLPLPRWSSRSKGTAALVLTGGRLRADGPARPPHRPPPLPQPAEALGGATGGRLTPGRERGRAPRGGTRGTRDVPARESRLRQRVIDVARDAFERYGYGAIVTPTFEETEVFVRGVGHQHRRRAQGDVHVRGPAAAAA